MDKAGSDNEDNGDYFNPEEEVDTGGDSKACTLPKVEVKSGEEDEDLIFKTRGRIYRWRDGEWKERGTGEIRLLRGKTVKSIRFLLRQDKTLKGVANFVVSAADKICDLQPHQGSDKIFFFVAYDCSEEEAKVEKFVLKLGNAELAKKFKEAFLAARQFNKDVKDGKEPVMAPIVIEEKEKEKEKEKENK